MNIGLKDIKDYNSLYLAYSRLFTEGNRTAKADNASAIFGKEIDTDKDGTAELWEFMQAANEINRSAIFKEIESLKKFENIHCQYISKDNPIHLILAIESESTGYQKVDISYKKIDKMIQSVKDKIPANITPEEKLQMVFNILKDDFDVTYNEKAFLSDGIGDECCNFTDCDTGSYLYYAIAHEMNWPLYLVPTLNHMLVRWQKGTNDYFYFETTDGRLKNDKFYHAITDNLTPYFINDANYLVAHMLSVRGLENSWRNESRLRSLAKADLTRSAQLNPMIPNNYGGLASVYAKEGRNDLSLNYRIECLKKDAHYLWNYNVSQGVDGCFVFSNRPDIKYEDSDVYIRTCLGEVSRNNMNAGSYIKLANAYIIIGDYDKALENYKIAVSLDQNCAFAYNNKGTLDAFNHDYADAYDAFLKSVELDQRQSAPYINLANIFMEMGQYDMSIYYYSKAIDNNEKGVDKSMAEYWIGVAYCHMKKYDKALEAFKEMDKKEPGNIMILEPISLIYGVMGNMKEAKHYDKMRDKASKNFKFDK